MPVNYTFVLCSGKTKWNEWSYLVEINYYFKVQYSTEYSTVRFNISYRNTVYILTVVHKTFFFKQKRIWKGPVFKPVKAGPLRKLFFFFAI